MKKSLKIIALLSLSFSLTAFSQTNEELLAKGLQYKKDLNYKDGIAIFQRLLKSDSSNVDYLYNASNFYSRYGHTLPEAMQLNCYKTAEYLAKKAIKADNNNAECHYVYALALGRINENASTKQKIANAKLIKSELDVALKQNPKHAGAWHILGRWHRTIAGFSTVEKFAINTLFGGVPQGGSYEDAVKCFTQAIILEPNYKLHKFELAETYYEMNKNADAKVWLQKILSTPSVTDDDKNTDVKSKELLAKMK